MSTSGTDAQWDKDDAAHAAANGEPPSTNGHAGNGSGQTMTVRWMAAKQEAEQSGGKLNLVPEHLAELERSGLTIKAIMVSARTETNSAKLQSILETKQSLRRCGAAIVYEYYNLDGENRYKRIKLDHPRKLGGRHAKYEGPKGIGNQPYFPRTRDNWAQIAADPACDLHISEGEKKAVAVDQLGFPCIGIPGVDSWKVGQHHRLLPDLDRFEWQGRKVYIDFDSDIADKAKVQEAEAKLAAMLAKKGADVRCVRVPPGPPDSEGNQTKQGIDDHLARFPFADRPAELVRLQDEAIDPPSPKSVEMRESAGSADPGDEAAAIVKETTRPGDEVSRLRFYRGDWLFWSGGQYKEIEAAEVQARIIRHLRRNYTHIGGGPVSNVAMHLRADCHLRASTKSCTWVGEPPVNWPADELLPTREHLIHLPSLIDNVEPWRIDATPHLFVQTAIPAELKLDAPRPENFLQFLDQVFDGDLEAVELLQEWCGYVLVPDTSQQKILFIIGPPRSGKGTIGRILQKLIGPDNIAGPTLASLAGPFGLQPLLGKSLAIVSDGRLSGRTDQQPVVERMLSISGEDAIGIDRKNSETVVAKLDARLMLMSNELPRLSESSGALATRLLFLRLTRSFLGKEDHALTRKLLAELPSILLWAVEGWGRLRSRGYFKPPASSAGMAEQMDELASPVRSFVKERCVIAADRTCVVQDLFEAWREHCKLSGRDNAGTVNVFGRDLRAAYPSVEDGPRVSHVIENGSTPTRLRTYRGIDLIRDL